MLSTRVRVAAALCIVGAIALVYKCEHTKTRGDVQAAAAAENQVYEAIVRSMVTPEDIRSGVSQLVFDEDVSTGVRGDTDRKSCTDTARTVLRLENDMPPPFNTLADKVYRFFADGGDFSLRADTIQDFVGKYCTPGRLSQTFHTDLPRAFVATNSIYIDIRPIHKQGSKSFRTLFPGATGIISLSRVGFDKDLHQAIVYSSFVCGALCGGGQVQILRKRRGRWEVAGGWGTWVS